MTEKFYWPVVMAPGEGWALSSSGAEEPGCICLGTPLLTDILTLVLGERAATLGTRVTSFKAGCLEVSQ